jgi:hypothetical protein
VDIVHDPLRKLKSDLHAHDGKLFGQECLVWLSRTRG